MKDFVFCNPTKIVFGEDTVSRVGEELSMIGKKVLFVYGRSHIKQTGLYDKIIKSLVAAELDVIEFPGVRPNPVLSHAREGVALANKERVDVILAVGGGSVIDESKAIAAGAVTDVDIWEFFTGAKIIEAALPVCTVLTIPATGSEMNPGMVITNDEIQDKFGFRAAPLYPRFSILDPTLTYSLPPAQTAYGAVDATAHLLEGYFTHRDQWAPIQDRYAEGLVKTIMESVEIILRKPDDYQGRATMMWAATLAWNRLSVAGVGPVQTPNHMLEHPLSAVYDIAHGAGLAVVIPAWMTWTARREPGRIARLGRTVFGVDEPDDAKAAKGSTAALKAWYEKIGAPTSFKAAGVTSPDIDMLADKALKQGKRWGITSYTKQDIAEIYQLCGT